MEINLRLGEFDRLAAGLGLLVAIALLPVQLFISHIYAQTLPIVLGLASVAYLLGQRGETRTEGTPITLPTTTTHALPSVVVVGSAVALVLANLQGGRTPIFLIVMAGLSTALLAQILFAAEADLHPGVILLQVLIVSFTLRFAALFTTAQYIGLDVWEHLPNFTAGMLEAGSIGGMGQTKYVMAPLYHLAVAAMSLLGDIGLRTASELTIGLAMVLSVAIIYYTARLLVPPRWALFAVTVFAISGSVIRWGMHLIPTSISLAFFVVILYLIVRILQLQTTLRDTALLLLLFVAMALTNQVSAFITLIFLGAGWLTRIIIGTGILDRQLAAARDLNSGDVEAVPFGGYFAFNLGLLTLTWSLTPYYGQPFLQTAFGFLFDAVSGGGSSLIGGGGGGDGPEGPDPTLFQEIVTNFDVAGFLFFFFITTVGSLYALRKGRATQAILTLVTAVVVMTAFTLLPPVIGIGTFLSGRWFAFLFAIMAIVGAVGLDYLNRGLSPTLFLVVLVIIMYAFPMVMIASPKGTVDDPVAETYTASYNFDETEIAARETLRTHGDSDMHNPIATDNPYVIMLNDKDETRFVIASIPPGGQALEERTLYRSHQTNGAPYFGDAAYARDDVNRSETGRLYRIRPSVMCQDKSTYYTNGDARLCS